MGSEELIDGTAVSSQEIHMRRKRRKKSGVYCVLNLVNSKRYIGSASISLLSRMRAHRKTLREGRHFNRHLQAAWDLYGESNFTFQVMTRCRPSKCIECEQTLIDEFKSADPDFGYNISPTAGSNRGMKHSEETRVRMKEAGQRKSEEFCMVAINAQRVVQVLKRTISAKVRRKLFAARSMNEFHAMIDALPEEVQNKLALATHGEHA
jgi:group I intron endonuclease